MSNRTHLKRQSAHPFAAVMTVAMILFAGLAPAHGQHSTVRKALPGQRERLEQHVYTLAADSLNGRSAGSPDARRAAAYIARQWNDMGLKPFLSNKGTYFMPFSVGNDSGYCNLVAIIEGNDPALKNEYIVVGGHYDHLGVMRDRIYNGADDNASGTACVTEMARQLLARQGELRRSVIICAFDAEEIGLHGSDALSDYMKKYNLLDRVKLMMSVDMVGWLKQGGSLELNGTGTLQDGKQLTDPATLGVDIPVSTNRFETSPFGATDTEPFAKKGVPTLAVTTGLKSPYHKPEDDANLIDYEGLDLVTDYMAALTLRVANHQGTLASGKFSPKHIEKPVPFSIGLTVGPNGSKLRFPKAAFNSKSHTGGQAGIALQCNFNKNIALHTDILYAYTCSAYPDVNDLFGSELRLRQQTITVPLMLRFTAGNYYSSFFINLGGYYNYELSSGFFNHEGAHANPLEPAEIAIVQACRTHQWGWCWGIGFRFTNHWEFSINDYYQLNSLFPLSIMPLTHNARTSFMLTYYFM